MGIAVAPRYLPAEDFKESSPGLRFGMYLPAWSADYAMEKAKGPALKQVCNLTPHDVALARALHDRQQALAKSGADAALSIEATSVSPFTSGLGNEHPLENGFAFLNPYGLPYLPGSGVKGVLRRAAQELALLGHESWRAAEDVLFGREPNASEIKHFRGVLTFWDVLPQVPGDKLLVEVMTPHQSHYIQKGESPHDSGRPNPILFLTVPPMSRFTFHVACDLSRLRRIAPSLVDGDAWRALLITAFEHSFDWLGFGAKTAVGYGALSRDEKGEQAARDNEREAAQRRDHERRRVALSANLLRVDDYSSKMAERQALLRVGLESQNGPAHNEARQLAVAAAAEDWSPEEKRAAADAIEEWLPKLVARVDMREERKKLGLRKLRGEA